MVVFKLREFLKANNITAYEFGKFVEQANLMSAIAVRKFANSDRFPRETSLDTIIKALRDYTGKEVAISDLLEYIPDVPKKKK